MFSLLNLSLFSFFIITTNEIAASSRCSTVKSTLVSLKDRLQILPLILSKCNPLFHDVEKFMLTP